MWQEFQAMTETMEWENSGGFIIERARGFGVPQVAGRDLEIDLRIVTGADEEDQLWRLRCAGVVAQSLGFDWGESIEYLDQHTLLWPHQRPATLWFSGRVDDAAMVTGHLYQAHVDLCAKWFAFDEFIQSYVRLSDLLSGPGGILATGPQNVLEAYAQVLEAHGARCSLFAHPPAAGVRLVLMDKFFVVCQHAALGKIDSEDGA